jgi:hypothetical protein
MHSHDKIKNSKSPGEDGMNSKLYKYAGKEFHKSFLIFLNNMYTLKKISSEWRHSIVIPIYKKADKTNPKNYRGISLLNTCHKIYIRWLNEKLSPFTEPFILEGRSGFRKGQTCIDNVFTLTLLMKKKRTQFGNSSGLFGF